MHQDRGNVKQLVMGMAAYTSASILGPLVVFLALGSFLDGHFGTRTVYKISSVIVAFVITNVLLFKKVRKLNAMMDAYSEEAKKKEAERAKEKKDKEIAAE